MTPAADVDLAIVGAGAAGIAAARTALAAGLTVAVLEARDRVGGRVVTASFGGHPVDLGAHWLHAGALNPLVQLARARGEPIRRSPGRGHLVINGTLRHAAESEAYGRAFDQADHAITLAAREPRDRALDGVLPPLGRFGRPIAKTLALVSGRPLREVSTKDFPSEEFGDNYFVRGGYGALLARFAVGLPVALHAPVRRIDWSGRGVTLEGPRGTVRARAAIVTVPLALLARGDLVLSPDLPDPLARAVASFRPGIYEHVILNWPGLPLPGADRLTKIQGRFGSFGLMIRMDGGPFHYLELDYAAVRAARGDRAALARHARLLLRDTFGALPGLSVRHVTDWEGDPWSGCSWMVAPPGAFAERERLGVPVAERLWLAGEANSRALWGTAGGAWAEGERAAREAVAALARPSQFHAASAGIMPSGPIERGA
ncbi:MAG: FAD-dependent oxidoreductase [Methylobacteriaceae bacterium]|nr:FAD-dependent oxidoreductase [Methylobacteriaceae bacterium]